MDSIDSSLYLGAICEDTKAEAIKGQRMNLIILLVRIILISQVDSDAKELVHLYGLKPKQNRPYLPLFFQNTVKDPNICSIAYT